MTRREARLILKAMEGVGQVRMTDERREALAMATEALRRLDLQVRQNRSVGANKAWKTRRAQAAKAS
jgi:hypothetical protein